MLKSPALPGAEQLCQHRRLFLSLSDSSLERAALCRSKIHPESMEQGLGGLGCASPAGERLPWQACFSCLSSFFSSVCYISKQKDVSAKTNTLKTS